MIYLIVASFYFYIPVALANIGANIAKFIPFFRDIKTPVDFGIKIKGQRIVGEHKLCGGLLFGILFGSLVGVIKYLFFDKYMRGFLILELNFTENAILYLLMSVCALMGDIIKSVSKRLLRIAPYKAWIPFDEIDHSTFSLFIAMFLFPIRLKFAITTIFIYFFLHIAANYIGFLLKIKKVPY